MGEKIGCPGKAFDEREANIVRAAHARYRLGVRMLEPVIRKRYRIRISHNRMHM